MKKGEKYLISFGGWYQRTTLHLSEIYDFLNDCESSLPLSKEKLESLWKSLGMKKVTKEAEKFEVVKAITKEGIILKYYEDGLHTLEIESDDIKKAEELLRKYYEEKLAPAINYIFSLGAPTPKILSKIVDQHPIAIRVITSNPNSLQIEKEFGEVYSKIAYRGIVVYKTKKFIFIALSESQKKVFVPLSEMQIFFREFKNQLHKYLNIHRTSWEYIDSIIAKKQIRGKEIDRDLRNLEGYQRTIGLIRFRINQMNSYISTRALISKDAKINEALLTLFEYRFEDLKNTLEYVKELWNATYDYTESAVSTLSELNKSAESTSLESLKIITSIGVVSLILGYLSAESYPTFSKIGISSFIIIIALAFLFEKILKIWGNRKKYEVEFAELKKDL